MNSHHILQEEEAIMLKVLFERTLFMFMIKLSYGCRRMTLDQFISDYKIRRLFLVNKTIIKGSLYMNSVTVEMD